MDLAAWSPLVDCCNLQGNRLCGGRCICHLGPALTFCSISTMRRWITWFSWAWWVDILQREHYRKKNNLSWVLMTLPEHLIPRGFAMMKGSEYQGWSQDFVKMVYSNLQEEQALGQYYHPWWWQVEVDGVQLPHDTPTSQPWIITVILVSYLSSVQRWQTERLHVYQEEVFDWIAIQFEVVREWAAHVCLHSKLLM